MVVKHVYLDFPLDLPRGTIKIHYNRHVVPLVESMEKSMWESTRERIALGNWRLVCILITYDEAAKMFVFGGLGLGVSFFFARLDGLPPRPLHLTRASFRLGLPFDVPNLLPVTLSDSTIPDLRNLIA